MSSSRSPRVATPRPPSTRGPRRAASPTEAAAAVRPGACLVDAESVPWIPFAPYEERVLVKYFRLDPVRGELIVQVKAPPGAALPMHRTSGSMIVYTLEGRWMRREADWIAGPGSVVYVTAASRQAPLCVVGDEAVNTLHVIQGDVVLYDERGAVLGTENWKTALDRYLAYCADAGVEPRDLTACS